MRWLNVWRSHHCVELKASSLFSPNRQAKEELGQSQYLAFEAPLLAAAVARPEIRGASYLCDWIPTSTIQHRFNNAASPLPLPLTRTWSAHGEQKAIGHWVPR
jgi:hypothetical protein